MDNEKELREQTNPVFNTAKSMLLLMIKQVGNGNLTVTGQNDTVQTIFVQTGFVDMIG